MMNNQVKTFLMCHPSHIGINGLIIIGGPFKPLTDLIFNHLEAILELGCQVIVLGLGDPTYIEALSKLTARRSSQLAAVFRFDEHLAHLIYAGSDFFLMPSVFEPCGLSQMISMTYATVPLAYKTGGLADTIDHGRNGLLFDHYTSDQFMAMINESLSIYNDCERFHSMRRECLATDFTWKESAKAYRMVYEGLMDG
jgi:starch synthase